MHCLVLTDTDLYSLTKGKSYLAKQKWRRSTCLRDQWYDVGCHPCVCVSCWPLYCNFASLQPFGHLPSLLALFYMMFSCVFVIFPYGILGQVW